MENITRKKGLVVDIIHNKLKVLVYRDSGCGSCSTCGGCEIKPTFINVYNANLDIKKGDQVYLETNTNHLYKAGFILYIFPLFMLVLGAIIPSILIKDSSIDINILTLISAFLFLILSIFILKIIDKRGKNHIDIKKINS